MSTAVHNNRPTNFDHRSNAYNFLSNIKLHSDTESYNSSLPYNIEHVFNHSTKQQPWNTSIKHAIAYEFLRSIKLATDYDNNTIPNIKLLTHNNIHDNSTQLHRHSFPYSPNDFIVIPAPAVLQQSNVSDHSTIRITCSVLYDGSVLLDIYVNDILISDSIPTALALLQAQSPASLNSTVQPNNTNTHDFLYDSDSNNDTTVSRTQTIENDDLHNGAFSDDDTASVRTYNTTMSQRTSITNELTEANIRRNLPDTILLPLLSKAYKKLLKQHEIQRTASKYSRYNDDNESVDSSYSYRKRHTEHLIDPSDLHDTTQSLQHDLLQQGIADNSTVYYTNNVARSVNRGITPLMIVSYQSYAHEQDTLRNNQLQRQYTNDSSLLDTTDNEQTNRLSLKQLRYTGQSYAHLLKPVSDNIQPYSPYYLDDPNLQTGKHRMVLNLSGYISSLVSYVRTGELKIELNLKFRSRHEWLEPSMSLSKIRALKSNLLLIGQKLDLELSTIAISYVYLEKLIIQNIVNKQNRKVIASVCILLALKYNEGMTKLHPDVLDENVTAINTLQKFQRKHFKNTLKKRKKNNDHILNKLFDSIYDVFDIKKQDVLKNEFYAFKELRFDLSVQTSDIMPHFKQILHQLENVDTQYLNIKWAL